MIPEQNCPDQTLLAGRVEAHTVVVPQPLKVLIVEDSALDCELVVQELWNAGFAPEWQLVETEAGFLAGLQAAPDIVLSDFQMPRFNGLRALELLQERGRDIPFILVSGTIGEDNAVEAMRQGAADYLLKDRLARLGAAVTRALGEARSRRERQRMEQAQAENAEFIRDVLNSLTSAVVVLDEFGTITTDNEPWRRFGRENGGDDNADKNYLTVCDTSVRMFGHADAQAAADGIRRVLEGTAAEFSMEYACHSPDEQRWFLMHVSPLSGAKRGVVVAHEKITDRKLAENSLRENEQRFRQLIENSSDVIAVVNSAGIIAYQSPSTLRVLGYQPEEVLGHAVTDFIHPEDRGRVAEGIHRALSDELVSVPVEYRVRHRDGQWRVFQSVGRAMSDSAGDKRVVVNSRDITDMHTLELQFLRAQRLEAIGTLSSGIAHDLNNILAPMIMIAPMLREKLKKPQDLELLSMIDQGAQRGANIIKQLLTFTRGVEGERGPVQSAHLLKEMCEIIRETFPRDISVHQNIASNLGPINADATQIHQVLMNLCVNARDAMPAGGKISLSAKNMRLDEAGAAPHPPAKPGDFVCLTISDTGEGISRENIDRIFEPFFTTKDIGKGTGLGLSTVLGIVKSHGGFVTVCSEPGRGTAFNVHLPAMQGMTVTKPYDVGLPEAGHRELILIVDDESSIRHTLGLTLERENYRVLVAADGAAAMALFQANRGNIRLLITDIMMPGMNGVTLIRLLRAEEPQLRVIATTGLHDERRREELTALGVTRILTKPFRSEDVFKAVHKELAAGAAASPIATRILIVDDHQMMRDGIHVILAKIPGTEVVGDSGDCAGAWQMADELRPDLILMDVDLPDGSGIDLTRRIRAEFPATKVIILTALLDHTVSADAVEAGAHGFLIKTSAGAELSTAVRTVLAGGFHLGAEMSSALAQKFQSAAADTAGRVKHTLPLREGQVLVLIVQGLRNKEIAAELDLNVKTVEAYRSRLMKRFDCTSPAELVRHAIRAGLATA